MKALVVLVLCVVGSCWSLPSLGRTKALPWREVIANSKANRIIGGSPAVVGQFPWQAAVIGVDSDYNAWLCGGSLIGRRWVLTAAHCVLGAVFFNVYLGGLTLTSGVPGTILLIPSYYIAHNGYNQYHNYDVGLICLDSLVNVTDRIAPIQLPSPGSYVGDGTKLIVSGWGKTSNAATSPSPVLNYVKVRAISNDLCRSVYGPDVVINSTLCTVGETNEGTCSHYYKNSGGPLVSCDENGVYTLEGVVSFGPAAGCGLGYPSGFVRVSKILKWIMKNTNNEVTPPP